ncbi:triose phosphate transporter [Cantharellus anzutake]|uniref:triose phosphate transporter n=1 Tax=Cantharellus anzutake TaxID=1750568 RepID=UPI0019038A89|nr:triose phosphate transporter [Cantharellus anzutake]KAF8324438.1 triose phosphate transporter [Cantharellus anzutake]
MQIELEPSIFPKYHHRSNSVASLTVEQRRRKWWRDGVTNLLFILSWYVFATLLSLYNKWMFGPKYFGFPNPLFVTSVHMFVQFSLSAVLRRFWPRQFKPKHQPTAEEYGWKAVPCAVATAGDIGFSNLSMKTITLSFYTMCKSSSLIFVLAFAFLFRLESFSWRLIAVIMIIFTGVVLMVATETQFELIGMLLVISASALGGLRWALTQILLRKKGLGMDNPAATVFWLAPPMGVTLVFLSGLIEGFGVFWEKAFFGGIGASSRTILFTVLPGVIAFVMVMSEYYIIQRVGMVPMSIAGIFKARDLQKLGGLEVSTIILSGVVYGDDLTLINMVGVGITVIGIGLFTYHKYEKSVLSPVPLDTHEESGGGDEEDLDEAVSEEDGILMTYQV